MLPTRLTSFVNAAFRSPPAPGGHAGVAGRPTSPPTAWPRPSGRRLAPFRASRVRRPRRPGRRGPHPAHPALRVTGPLRGPGRRQPPPRDLPHLRQHGRRRLRRRLRALLTAGDDKGYEIDEAEIIYWAAARPACPRPEREPAAIHRRAGIEPSGAPQVGRFRSTPCLTTARQSEERNMDGESKCPVTGGTHKGRSNATGGRIS